VFAVNNGQKFYRDPVFKDGQFEKKIAYSSGQQVKRSVIESLTSLLNVPFAPMTFSWYLDVDKKTKKAKPSEGVAYIACDPTFPDQLIGGYMLAESETYPVKRRSPLSISAMRPLHPLLGGVETPNEDMTFDRSQNSSAAVKVFWREEGSKLREVPEEELNTWLTDNKKTLPRRKFIQDQTRASGLFVYDIAIDLRTLFCVSINKLEPELFPEIEKKLREAGWQEGQNVFGKCLIVPKETRDKIIPALAHALVNWRITSNQARTFSLMESVAIAISDNANQIAYAIRGDLREDTERQQAIPRIDETAKADLFITPIAGRFIAGSVGSADAIDKAEQKLIVLMTAFEYENQLATV
jgi:hypothetical protein